MQPLFAAARAARVVEQLAGTTKHDVRNQLLERRIGLDFAAWTVREVLRRQQQIPIRVRVRPKAVKLAGGTKAFGRHDQDALGGFVGIHSVSPISMEAEA